MSTSDEHDATTGAMVRFVAFFFLFGCLGGVLQVYLPPYIKSLGFTSTELGQLLAIPPLLIVLFPLVWAQLADRYGIRLVLLRVLLFALVAVFSLFHVVDTGIGVAAALILLAIFRSGVLPLADALALSNLSSTHYVRTTIANGLSWVVATSLFAWLLADQPASDAWAIRTTHIMMALTAVYSLFLTAKAQPATNRPSFADSVALIRDPRIPRFLFTIMIYWIGMGPFETLLAIHTESVGYGADAAGYAFSVGITAELVVMATAKRFGFDLIALPSTDPRRAQRVMLVVMAATAARWALSSVAPNLPIFLALQTIHGLTFGAFILLAIGQLRVLVPERLRATGQALLFSSLGGVGGMLGSLIAGKMADIGGSELAFQVAGGIVMISFVLTATTPNAIESKT